MTNPSAPQLSATPEHKITDFSVISDLITIGTNHCCNAHTVELRSHGYFADIDLESERSEAPPNVPYYLWLPTKDHTASTPDQYLAGAMAITSLLRLNQRVYVHCHNGHGRSPAMVIAYLMMTGKSYDESFTTVKSKRPEMHLEGDQESVLRHLEPKLNHVNS